MSQVGLDPELLARATGARPAGRPPAVGRRSGRHPVRSSFLLIFLALALGVALAAVIGATVYGVTSVLHGLATS